MTNKEIKKAWDRITTICLIGLTECQNTNQFHEDFELIRNIVMKEVRDEN